MTRNQLIASGTSRMAGAASIEKMSLRRIARSARRRFTRRELFALPAALALMLTAAVPAVGQTTGTTGTSGYGQKPPAPTTKTEPKKAVEPSKPTTTPKTAPEPTTTTPATTTPTATTPAPKAATLPFTGLNLTWVLGAGLLLLSAGLAIRLAQRTRAGR